MLVIAAFWFKLIKISQRRILKASPYTEVLMLILHDSDQVVRDALNARARGFSLKSDAARDLVAAVEALQRGKVSSLVLYALQNNIVHIPPSVKGAVDGNSPR